MPRRQQLKIGSRHLPVSNLDKVLFPATGFSKGDLIQYYSKISPVLLPHLKDRPLTLKRYPEGVDGFHFYEKECPSHRPDWVQVAPVWSRQKKKDTRFCLVNDLASLVWVANLADLEMHTSLARARNPDRPTMMVFDLDPGPGTDVVDCAQVALWLQSLLEEAGLESFPKTSGSKGIQVYVPVNTPITFEKTKAWSHAIASIIAAAHPDCALTQMARRLRQNKVFIDWSQNDRHKTTVCVYSLRARETPSVSTPLSWDEVRKGLKKRKADAFFYTPEDVLKRMDDRGDLFEPVLSKKQKLLERNLERLLEKNGEPVLKPKAKKRKAGD